MVRVSNRFEQVRGINVTKPNKIHRPTVNSDSIGIIRVTNIVPITNDLSVQKAEVYAPCTISSSQVGKVVNYGHKRERTDYALGPCFVTNIETMIPGWAETVNHNFLMTGDYAALDGVNNNCLRERRHVTYTGDHDGLFVELIARALKADYK